MNVNDILNKAVELLGITDLTVRPQSSDPRVARLVTSLGVSYMRLITEYAPLEREENVTVSGGSLDLTTLNEGVFDVVRLTDESGEKAAFRLRGRTLIAEDGRYTIRYYALPSSYPAIGGTVEIAPQITLDLVARGVAAEYALASMMYEESLLHERKYKEGLAKALIPHAAKSIRVKRWI